MNKRNTSIRRRLLIGVLVTQALLTLGLALIAVLLTQRQLRISFDAALHGRAMSISALVRYSEETKPTLEFDKEMVPPPLERKHPDLYRVIDSNGRLLASSSNWPAGLDPVPGRGRAAGHWETKLNGELYRGIRLVNVPVLDREGAQNANDSLTVLYAASTVELQEAIWRAGALFVAASILLLGCAAAVAVWSIRRGLAPLAQLATSASQVSPSNWELRAPPESVDTEELAPLTHAMTTMLAKLEQAFTSQREFLADAAHELKTPVAILKSTLQSLAQRPRKEEEYREGIEAALEDTTRMEKLVHSMLRLARAEQWASGSLRRDLEEIDLISTCEISIANLRPVADARGIQVQLCREAEPKLSADAADLELVWGNLLDNAIRYSPAESTVRMTIGRTSQWAEVAVSDKGPGIPGDQLERIFDRFHRADSSRARSTGGYGLGLAIAKAIVEAYGGSITVETSVGNGTTMTVRLPLSA